MRVLLADDHRLMLEGLSNLLEAHSIEVVGMAKDGMEAITLSRKLKPDVILMDIRMPRCDGLAATRFIKTKMPQIKIIILTTSTEDEDLFEAIKSGASGYLLKSMDAGALVESIEGIQEGVPPFSPGLAVRLLKEFQRMAEAEVKCAEKKQREATNMESILNQRQSQVLTLVAQGLSYKEVGLRLSLSPRTIRYHMDEIIQRLHLENRAQVLSYAGKMGITFPDSHQQ
jgi:DNA-binding NarL/FixJ family response regulator